MGLEQGTGKRMTVGSTDWLASRRDFADGEGRTDIAAIIAKNAKAVLGEELHRHASHYLRPDRIAQSEAFIGEKASPVIGGIAKVMEWSDGRPEMQYLSTAVYLRFLEEKMRGQTNRSNTYESRYQPGATAIDVPLPSLSLAATREAVAKSLQAYGNESTLSVADQRMCNLLSYVMLMPLPASRKYVMESLRTKKPHRIANALERLEKFKARKESPAVGA